MTRNVRKRTFWNVRPTKTQNSLRIRAVWSVFVVCMMKLCILGYPKCAQWRFWSACWIFAGRTCPEVHSLTFRFICLGSGYCTWLLEMNIHYTIFVINIFMSAYFRYSLPWQTHNVNDCRHNYYTPVYLSLGICHVKQKLTKKTV